MTKLIINVNDLRIDDVVLEEQKVYRVKHLGLTHYKIQLLGLWKCGPRKQYRFTPLYNRQMVTRKNGKVRMTKGGYSLKETLAAMSQHAPHLAWLVE